MDFTLKLLEAATPAQGNSWTMILMMAGLFGAMYFLMIRPQKKKQKEEQEMRDAIQIGDEITTIGGICGRVVTVKEDSLVIETGADRNKIKFARWAIQTNNTAEDRLQAERAAQAAAKEAEKAEKAKGRRSKKSEDEE
ncbi:MAG: preprotein translocase subunit YajC [Clostridia bacterium]|nr:preprotein translocase subunit YajC [Clostridia bacterium]